MVSIVEALSDEAIAKAVLKNGTYGMARTETLKAFSEAEGYEIIKGLPGPYCVATMKSDEYIKQHYPGEPMSEKEYHVTVEKIAGGCPCGGSYKFDAPPRCPKCHSAELKYDAEPFILYD